MANSEATLQSPPCPPPKCHEGGENGNWTDDDDDLSDFVAVPASDQTMVCKNHIPQACSSTLPTPGNLGGSCLEPSWREGSCQGTESSVSLQTLHSSDSPPPLIPLYANGELAGDATGRFNGEEVVDSGDMKREDSFDDFQQASMSDIPFEVTLTTVCEDGDDDGFADFTSAEVGLPVTLVGDEEDVFDRACFNLDDREGRRSADGFADFAAFEGAVANDLADDGWGMFSAQGDAVVVPSPERRWSLPGQQSEKSSPESLLRAVFPCDYPDSSEGLDEVVTPEPCDQHIKLWQRLQDLDQAPSLSYQWNSSLCCQHLLQSLSIDSRNILRNPSVPLFASHLGLLEPQRGLGEAAGQCSPQQSPLALPEESIPPAQFDWTSSGLVNPLEQPSASTLLDLEFLSTLSSAGASASAEKRTSSLEEEFLGGCSPSSPMEPAPASKLQQLLESNVSTLSSTRRRPSLLSADAQRVLDRLPDLSFMQARVLMFPIHLD